MEGAVHEDRDARPWTGQTGGRRALVVTVVHHPQDSRIRHRQISALLAAGWQVTYAAPFGSYPDSRGEVPARLCQLDLPRAAGRRRVGALRAARELLAAEAGRHDVVLLHDPELLLALPGLRLPAVIWDVHEDTAAATSTKSWLPDPLRRPTRSMIGAVERIAEQRVHLLLAEAGYQARFTRPHLVVSNTVSVPDRIEPPGDDRVVYIGHLTRARGVDEMIETARRLSDRTAGQVSTHVIGHADARSAERLRAAEQLPRTKGGAGLTWHGFLPSGEALSHLRGAMAGLALLHNHPNYRVSTGSKVIEYMAYGVPVVATELPLVADLLDRTGSGVVVPFQDPGAATEAVLSLWADPSRRASMGKAGHAEARASYDWRALSAPFVNELDRVSRRGARR
jgi:glycosyltransferase involved in cell wall biosynthesis